MNLNICIELQTCRPNTQFQHIIEWRQEKYVESAILKIAVKKTLYLLSVDGFLLGGKLTCDLSYCCVANGCFFYICCGTTTEIALTNDCSVLEFLGNFAINYIWHIIVGCRSLCARAQYLNVLSLFAGRLFNLIHLEITVQNSNQRRN